MTTLLGHTHEHCVIPPVRRERGGDTAQTKEAAALSSHRPHAGQVKLPVGENVHIGDEVYDKQGGWTGGGLFYQKEDLKMCES
jgi:hypothetical protein